MEKPVLFEIENEIGIITLNRPHRSNAINQDLLIHLFDCIEEVAVNNEIRVGIITGNGNSFCSGIDLAAVETDDLLNPRGDGTDFMDVIHACKKLIIGAINGHTITGGLEIALNCDFLIASERASFRDTHARIGICPGWGMTQLLQQAVGLRMAKQISFTGEPISAQSALRCGLVNEVVPHEQLMKRSRHIAMDICAANQDVLAVQKDLMEFRSNATLDEALARERKRCMEITGKSWGGSSS